MSMLRCKGVKSFKDFLYHQRSGPDRQNLPLILLEDNPEGHCVYCSGDPVEI